MSDGLCQREEDDQFFQDYLTLRDERAARDEREAAAQHAVAYAQSECDRLAWALLFAVFEEYVARDEPVPKALLQGISTAFAKFRAGGTLDQAFGVAPKAGKGLEGRWWAQTNASLVAYFVEAGHTLDEAVSRVCNMRQDPDERTSSKVKRDYYEWRDQVKRSE